MIKRITAALLALLMCFAVVGCSRDGAPDGMHLVSAEGEPFKLYVPEVWQSNASSGISGAFLSATDNIAVSARYFTPESSEQDRKSTRLNSSHKSLSRMPSSA